MNWIDVNDDLPPAGAVVLANCSLGRNEVRVISDAYFDPSRGWFTNGYDDQIQRVHHWHPLSDHPPKVKEEESLIRAASAGFLAACEIQDDSP